jgi:phage gp36-like protein
MFATRADIEAIYGARHLETLVPVDVDFDVAVNRALAAAQSVIESYIRKRYAVPVTASPVPASLMNAAIDIACWKLAPSSDRNSAEITLRAKAHIDWLKDVAGGKADIDELEPASMAGAAGQTGAASEGGAVFVSDARRFERGGRLL